jgi:HD-GYP domain-containing protein (c-di-GMP phosphodiesterase class II)/DNA-binding CsgD family transcriptional regulator
MPKPNERIRLVEVLGALSLATDLGAGVPFEKGLRTCVAASALADVLDLDLDDRRAVYFAAMLRSLGCTANAPEFARMFDDDVAVQRELKTMDVGDHEVFAAQMTHFGDWTGPERASELARRFAVEVPKVGGSLGRAGCEVSTALGTRLELPVAAIGALDQVYERWDGLGFPDGRAGEDLMLAARVVHVAEQAVLAHFAGAREGAVREVERRAGGHLDPGICAGFVANSDRVLGALDAPDMLAEAAAAEPAPAAIVSEANLERVCSAFATFADLKGTRLLGHSARVAGLADGAGSLLGLGDAARRRVRIAGLLHDVGRVGVSSAIWDRPTRLGPVEWERVRLHPYWTQRILGRCSALAEIAPLAAAHHERLDGSGYHRGARGSDLSQSERLLAAADVFAALTEGRPQREAYSNDAAAALLAGHVADGQLDGEAAGVVVEAAGLPRRRTVWPNELTTREVEVLRLVARGMTNRQVADSLVLSARTVQRHLANVYDKTGRRTRAGAAVFAMEQGLVPALNPG